MKRILLASALLLALAAPTTFAARNIEAEGNRLCAELDTNLSVLPGKQAVKRVPKIKPEPLYGTEVAA